MTKCVKHKKHASFRVVGTLSWTYCGTCRNETLDQHPTWIFESNRQTRDKRMRACGHYQKVVRTKNRRPTTLNPTKPKCSVCLQKTPSFYHVYAENRILTHCKACGPNKQPGLFMDIHKKCIGGHGVRPSYREISTRHWTHCAWCMDTVANPETYENQHQFYARQKNEAWLKILCTVFV